MPAELLIDAVTQGATSEERSCGAYDKVYLQIWSAAGSTATVLIETRADVSGSPWITNTSISNPTNPGAFYLIPSTGLVRVRISVWTGGTISAALERNRVNS